MKKLGLMMLIMVIGVWGCVTVDNSTMVDADSHGYATGQYRDVRHGTVADFGIYGGGAGASAASSAAGLAISGTLATAASLSSNNAFANNSKSSSGGGGGMLGFRVHPAPTQGDPLPFARSVALINYSKKLTKVTYDDCGLVSYEFGEPGSKPRASSFGHQPIQ